VLPVVGLALLTLALALEEGRAQQYVGQDGRLFDANPQLGGSRYNYARPAPPLIGGNLYATGNIGRGLSLRSFSPIGSPTAFRATIGSGSLSNFIRDSVSVGDQSSLLGGLVSQPFYDPARTAPTAGYLRGFYAAQPTDPAPGVWGRGTGTQGGTSPLGSGLSYGAPPAPRVTVDSSEQWLSQTLGMPLNTELSSTIFGVERPRLPGPLSSTALLPESTYTPQARPEGFSADLAQASSDGVYGPLDLRIGPELRIQSLPTPLDILAQESATQALAERPAPTLGQRGGVSAVSELGGRGLARATGMRAPGEALVGAGVLPGSDVFTDLQLALELSLDPQAEWYAEMLAASPASPTERVDEQARAAAAAGEFLERVYEKPVQSFVGQSETALNDELRAAEAAMDMRRYYDATRHYERARMLDPANPLPLIGKGHALLAAGEYASAAYNLINGLERFPGLTRFEIDLTALVGGGEIVDIRRADLMKLLARNEDPQLRFLLGYLEIHSGNTEFGMENLDQAAREARPGTLISRYPDMVRRKGLLPVPKLPADVPPDSGIDAPPPPTSEPPAAGKDSE
jgi:hypothetical protein